ncbi:hypothetical protein SS50377_21899 [Spironucleus salmonicida]|uniref:Uncharacterized protein n=1 Tax=Spironucleus salmonicida TaxID=348837 RepID=V6LIL9_9EUKA|nr:hypothetical protein SS50377_21899 [Spironucleus salmonicida]|eukprot:EST44440.1 Hypothetical protein SS50377_15748 [Spironucleus salmonicida]
MDEFYTHTPTHELRKNPVFLRTPSSLEKKRANLPQVPRQQLQSKILLQKFNEKPKTPQSPQKQLQSRQSPIKVNPALKANSPYRKHNFYKAQMVVPQQRGQSQQSQNIRTIISDTCGSFDMEPNFDVKPDSTQFDQKHTSQTDESGMRTVDFSQRYEQQYQLNTYVSPKREIQLSEYCDYDEQARTNIPFSGSIKIARITRQRQETARFQLATQEVNNHQLYSTTDTYNQNYYYEQQDSPNVVISEQAINLDDVELSDKSDFNAPDEEYQIIDEDFD